MKQTALILCACTLISACTATQQPVERACPSCNPPIRRFEIITECSDYRDTPISGNSFSQCRYCTNRIYSNGIDVTNQFMGMTQAVRQPVRPKPSKRQYRCLSDRPTPCAR